MTAAAQILEIPEVRARISPVTVEQYHQFPELNANGRRTELIRGVVIEKMSKSPLHSGIASALYDLLRPQIPSDYWLRKEEPLTLVDSEPEPDLSLVRGHRTQFAASHPTTALLIIEIAVSSAAEDRALASLYAGAGVEEYWIVLPTQRRVEVFRRPQNGAYLEHDIIEGGMSVRSSGDLSLEFRLQDLFGDA